MRCAVLGRPIAHSLSPALHRAAYEALGLTDWRYERHDVGAEELPAFVEACDAGWRGLSVTMPLKEVVLDLGQPDPVAAAVHAGNTLIFDTDARRVYNTDVEGLTVALRRAGVERPAEVVLLGAGATARSAAASVADLGARRLTVVARDPGRARPVARIAERAGLAVVVQRWGDRVPEADVLVSTATAGAVVEDGGPLGAEALARCAPVVFDAVYDPWPTPLAAAASRAGAVVVSGLDLLVAQAVAQIRLMTGSEVGIDLLLQAGRRALAADHPGP